VTQRQAATIFVLTSRLRTAGWQEEFSCSRSVANAIPIAYVVKYVGARASAARLVVGRALGDLALAVYNNLSFYSSPGSSRIQAIPMTKVKGKGGR